MLYGCVFSMLCYAFAAVCGDTHLFKHTLTLTHFHCLTHLRERSLSPILSVSFISFISVYSLIGNGDGDGDGMVNAIGMNIYGVRVCYYCYDDGGDVDVDDGGVWRRDVRACVMCVRT